MSENVSPHEAKAMIEAMIAEARYSPTEKKKAAVKETKTLLKAVLLPKKKMDEKKGETSKYARYTTDMESLKDAYHAMPSVYKFFLMIYRLSPMRTLIIIAVFMIQGLLPALRLRTGGDFIKQVQEFQGGPIPPRPQ